MKKIFYSVLFAAIGAFAISSCEDVPEPYTTPGTGGESTDTTSVVTAVGDGSEANPYNVVGVKEFIDGGDYANKNVYFKGIVTSFKSGEEPGNTYGNATFYIADEAGGSNTFYCYRIKGFNNKSFTTDDANLFGVGDTVVVCGQVTLYSGSVYETTQNTAYLVSVNGKKNGSESSNDSDTTTVTPVAGTGTQDAPLKVSEALSIYDESTTISGVWVKGFIVAYIPEKTLSAAVFGTSGAVNTNLLIAESADETDYNKCLVIQLPANEVRDVVNLKDHPENYKQEVTLYGDIVKYFGAAGLKNTAKYILGDKNNTEEVTATHITVAEFLSKADANTTYELTGTVKNIKNTTYGNFDLEEDGSSIYIYGLLDLNSKAQNFASLGISEGTKITIKGKYVDYNGTAEIKNAQLVRIEK